MARCEHDRVTSTCSICKPEQVFKQYQYKAKQRGLSFRLTLNEFEKIIRNPCSYCGEDGEPRGLDRVDNTLAYHAWNVVASCSECNFMKRAMNKHRFMNRAIKIAKHQEALRRQKPERSKVETESPAVVGTNMPGRIPVHAPISRGLVPRLSPEARRFLDGI